jgi:hypothetical protein
LQQLQKLFEPFQLLKVYGEPHAIPSQFTE